jgi:nitrate/nitrite transporter NarK
VPFVDSLFTMEVLITAAILFSNAANALNYAVAADLTHDRESAGAVFGLLVLGGNSFGFLAPILTGLIIAYTQEYTYSFVLAAGLLLAGIAITWLLVRRPLQPIAAQRSAVAA